MDEDVFLKQYTDYIKRMFKEGVRPECNKLHGAEEFMIPMGDGTRLRTMVFFPQGEGPFPTLFTRSPYPVHEKISRVEGEEYAKRGYAYCIQFCRGTNGSEGEWVPNENERDDGIDSINWLAQQNFVSSIGVHGSSYMALTGWIIADQLPDKVKTMYLSHYSVDRFCSAYKDGLFRHDVLTGWAMENSGKPRSEDFYKEYIKAALYRPHMKVDEDLWGIKLEWYRKWITNTDRNCEYWQSGVWKTLREIPPKIKVPVCVVAGWYDHHLEGTILGYEELSEENKRHSKLVIGGWNHFFQQSVPAHNPQNADFNNVATMFDWFDRILVKGILPEPCVETYMIGDDKWCSLDTWLVKTSDNKELYIDIEKRNDNNAYKLNLQQGLENRQLEYEYDPNNPVYSRGGETLLVSEKERGSQMQPEPGYREDVISFVSDTLIEDIPIVGKMNVKIYVSSDCEDTSFTAKIMEILPNGDAYNIRSSITTLAYRNNGSSRKSYLPGNIVDINIEMLPITWNVKKGSRLRVDISSSNFPEYTIHTNYPGNWASQDKVKTAHQKIYSGGKYVSKVEIPVFKEQRK